MLKDIVKANRSYRGYDETYRFTREQLEELVDLTRYTASSVNAQPLKYYIAWEKDKVDLIQSMTKWGKALTNMELPHPGKCPTAFVVICHDTSVASNITPFLKDVGIVAQTMLLGAAEQGLGGCMIGNFSATEVKEKLGLAANLEPQLVVALGKPDETIVLEEINDGESTKYHRDEQDVHYVPKRKLTDIII